MLFKPDLNETAKAAGDRVARVASRARRRTVSITITLLILGGLGYIAWTSLQQKQAANRARPDLPVPVLAATPRIQDVPVYLDGVGAVRALNNVLVRSQVDGKLIVVNFTEGQDVKKGDVLGEIDPVIYKAQYDQAVAKKAQDEAQLANQRLDLARYQQLAASNAGSKQQADTQRAVVAQQEALVNADQAAIDNMQAMLGYTKIIAPLSGRRPASGRPGQHHPRLRCNGSRDHHPVAADRGAVQPAAAADRAGQCRLRQWGADRRCVRQ